jgi:hypothetical protein
MPPSQKMIGAYSYHRKRRRQCTARHHMFGSDDFLLVVEIQEIPGDDIDGADSEMHFASVDEIEVDQLEQRIT